MTRQIRPELFERALRAYRRLCARTASTFQQPARDEWADLVGDRWRLSLGNVRGRLATYEETLAGRVRLVSVG